MPTTSHNGIKKNWWSIVILRHLLKVSSFRNDFLVSSISSKKRTKIVFWRKSNDFRSFFWGNQRHKKPFRNYLTFKEALNCFELWCKYSVSSKYKLLNQDRLLDVDMLATHIFSILQQCKVVVNSPSIHSLFYWCFQASYPLGWSEQNLRKLERISLLFRFQ